MSPSPVSMGTTLTYQHKLCELKSMDLVRHHAMVDMLQGLAKSVKTSSQYVHLQEHLQLMFSFSLHLPSLLHVKSHSVTNNNVLAVLMALL